MSVARAGAGVLLGILLLIPHPARAGDLEAGLGLTGLVGAGYDSNYTLLYSDRNVPPPHAATSGPRAAGLWTAEVGAVGWMKPLDVLELTLEPSFRTIHFFDNEFLVEPSVDLSVYVLAAKVLTLGFGGGYRYYSFSYLSEERFHEPHAWFEIAIGRSNHRLAALYMFAYRSLPPIVEPLDNVEQNETEHAARLTWEILFAHMVTLGIGVEYDHVRGTESWMQEDTIKGVLALKVAWRMIDAGVAYVPGLMWLENDGMGMLNRVSVWAGARYPGWIRYGVEYRYDDLMEIDALRAEVPYERHLALFTVTLSWGISTSGTEPEAEKPGPIIVTPGHASFRVDAPGATSVSLVGSFNGWETPGPAFEGPDEQGTWTLEQDLPPGRHEIVYLVDGETVTPPDAPGYASDGFGGKNAVIIVPR